MTEDREIRITEPPEVRELDGVSELHGHAAVFNTWSENLGGFKERILPGFFADVIGDDVRALWQHKPEYVLGRSTNGTMQMWEDEVGLAYRIVPPDTQWARDAMVSVRRRDVTQMSIAFAVKEQVLEPRQQDGLARRTLVKAKGLFDLSPVTYPAYPQTTAQLRSQLDALRAQAQPTDEPAGDDHGRDANLRAWYELKSTEVRNE